MNNLKLIKTLGKFKDRLDSLFKSTTKISSIIDKHGKGELKGERGRRGEQGMDGEQGSKGDRGSRGWQGVQGDQGEEIKGTQGERGPIGKAGEDGSKITAEDIKRLLEELEVEEGWFDAGHIINLPELKTIIKTVASGGGAVNFTALFDTPAGYENQANRHLVVNAAEDKVVFSVGTIVKTTRVTAAYTILVSDEEIFCDTDGGAFTVTLPVGVDGQTFRIIDCGTSGNDLTIAPNGAELLTGANSSKATSDGSVIILTYETTEGWY